MLRKGIFDIKAESYTEPGDGVPFIRIGDLDGCLTDESSCAWISNAAHLKEKATALRKGDIAIAKTAYATAALVTAQECNVSQDIIAVQLSARGRSMFHSEFVVAFLCSDLGISILGAEFQGNVQEHLSLADVRKLPIPRISNAFQAKIRDLFTRAISCREDVKSLLSEGEQKFSDKLGISGSYLGQALHYEAGSAAVKAAGRLDSQYFMPEKARALSALAALPGRSLGSIFQSVRDTVDPKKESSLGLVRNFDLPHALQPVLDDELLPIDISEVGSLKKRLEKDDVVISRLRHYLKEIAIVDCSTRIPVIGSSEFIVLRRQESSCKISPASLLIFLRSTPVQTILKWCQDGSQHPRFSEDDLLSISVPNCLDELAPELDRIVKKAFVARREARSSISTALKSVKIAVESTEADALRFVQQAGF